MPTGYTSIIEEGATFEEFVWRCARAMGALIMMRDDPLDAPIPERFEPTDYHQKQIKQAKEKVAALERMTAVEREAEGRRLKSEAVARTSEWLDDELNRIAKYKQMSAKVDAWQPPTPDHQGFKDFMVEQIRISTQKPDWARKAVEGTRLKGPTEFFADALMEARRSVTYHEEEHAKEVERIESRNQWLAALRGSVPMPERDAETRTMG